MVKIKFDGYARLLIDRIKKEGVSEDEAFSIYTNLLAAISTKQIQMAIVNYHSCKNQSTTEP